MSRANKKSSLKRIIPREYIQDPSSLDFLEKLTSMRLLEQWCMQDIIGTLALNLLNRQGLANKAHVTPTLASYAIEPIEPLLRIEPPYNERDILGLAYQILLTEGEKNAKGSYYTPAHIVESMLAGLRLEKDARILDPCCGSGSFFLSLKGIQPHQIIGFDIDPIAVMIAKINLLLHFPDEEFTPRIYHYNYLSPASSPLDEQEFDAIITNPPWCEITQESQAPAEISSNESSSCFFVKAYKQLKQGGDIRFLLPESLLKVKAHTDIRRFMLEHCCMHSIHLHAKQFSQVTTPFLSIHCSKASPQPHLHVSTKKQSFSVDTSTFRETSHSVFRLISREKSALIQKINALGRYTLTKSTWALGIVTGNNKATLHEQMSPELEPILTGKEIQPYRLKPAQKYIRYERAQLQQVAKEELYRAKEKLVYKFISSRLTFAYDDKQQLFLNSANILIPQIPHMSIKTVMAFLNSSLFQFYYRNVFAEIKVLKGNLLQLPFPQIDAATNKKMQSLVDKIMQGETRLAGQLQALIYELYNLSSSEIQLIEQEGIA